jgi:organic radical activating enzyme
MNFPITVKEVQYYINNSCNLSCNNCCSFNNLNFKGYSKWEDHKEKNALWPKFINPGRVSILGGETFLNPNLLKWVQGVRSAWATHKNITVATNGTLLSKPKARKIAKEIMQLEIQLEIAVHYEKDYEQIYQSAENILKEIGVLYDIKRSPIDFTGYDDRTTFFHPDTKQIFYTIHRKYQFECNSVESIKNNTINFYSSNIEKSHDVCIFRECHYIVNGDLYKCVVTAVGSELIEQYITNGTELLKKYKPCSPFDDPKNILDFLKEIKNPIEQCSLCPTKITIEKII